MPPKSSIIALEVAVMDNRTDRNAERALNITMALTLIVAGYEICRACQNYKPGMNFLDIASYANADLNTYCMVLILVNIIFLPGALLLYKQSGMSLKDEIFHRESLWKDIALGTVLALVSSMVSLLSFIINKGRTGLAFPGWEHLSLSELILMTVSLGFVSGICKEIYFRGFAKNFCGPILGGTTSLLLFNMMFAMLDWFNMGLSFILGLLWIWGYKKSGRLIVPIIAHGGVNLISIIFYMVTT